MSLASSIINGVAQFGGFPMIPILFQRLLVFPAKRVGEMCTGQRERNTNWAQLRSKPRANDKGDKMEHRKQPRGSEGQPRSSQETARSSQEQSGNSQEAAKAQPGSNLEHPEAAKKQPGEAKAARSSQETAREQPGNNQEQPRADREQPRSS